MIPLRAKDTDISSDVQAGKEFEKLLLSTAEAIVEQVGMEYNGLSEAVAERAKDLNFTRLQIQRLLEEVNTLSFNHRYKKMMHSRDRRVEFALADLGAILSHMGDAAPPELENPNFPGGFIRPSANDGYQPLSKVASEESPFANLTMEKLASFSRHDITNHERHELEKKAKRLNMAYLDGITKIANAIVWSDFYKGTGSDVYDVFLDSAGNLDKIASDLDKTVSDVTNLLIRQDYLQNDFSVNLERNGFHKKANNLFGSSSLLGGAATEKVNLHPVDDVTNHDDLLKVAKTVKNAYNEVNKILEVLYND